jgi:MFS family permease
VYATDDKQLNSAPGTERSVRFAAIGSRNFRLLWFGMLISNAGTWMESTAFGWLITDLEPARAAFWLGVTAAAFALPMLILPPFGGAIADRFPRLRLLWVVQSLYLLMSALIAVVTLAGTVSVWMLAGYSFGLGTVLAFDAPARHSLLPDIVSREQLMSAVSLNSVAFTGASLIGPAIAGLLIPFIGIGGVLICNVVSCLATLVALALMRDIPVRAAGRHDGEPVLRSIGRGVAYIVRSPLLRGLILVSALSGMLVRSYGPLLAVFARDEFHVGASAYGAMISAGGLGTLIGAFGIAGSKSIRRRGRMILIGVTAQGVSLLLFAVSPWYVSSLPILGLAGIASAVSGASIATLIQLTVPPEIRGRIMSLYLLTVIALPSVGSFVLGLTGDQVGVRTAIGVAAVAAVAIVHVQFRGNAALRTAE